MIRVVVYNGHGEETSGCPVENTPRLCLPAPANLLVITHHLGEGFLYERHPKVTVIGPFRVNRASTHKGQLVIDRHYLWLSLDENLHSYKTLCRVLVIDNNFVDAGFPLGHRLNRRQDETVIYLALDDVEGANPRASIQGKPRESL